jgi:hypothetical protein
MGVPNKFVDALIALKKIVPLQEETNMLMFPWGSHLHFIHSSDIRNTSIF